MRPIVTVLSESHLITFGISGKLKQIKTKKLIRLTNRQNSAVAKFHHGYSPRFFFLFTTF